MSAAKLTVAHRRVLACAKQVVKLWLLLDTRFPTTKGEFIVEMTRLRNAVDRLKEDGHLPKSQRWP